jgi:homotetrameric cytidine deaminase
MDEILVKSLIDAAFEAREKAYAPYSGMSVGAALLSREGKIFSGCNLENAAFGPTICAERAAVAQAVSAGCREFTAIAVCGGPTKKDGAQIGFFYPCGICRQVLAEFCPEDFPVIIARSEEDYREYTLAELLPHAFSPANLK